MATPDPALEPGHGPAELSSIIVIFVTLDQKDPLGSQDPLGWVTHVFHRLMKFRDFIIHGLQSSEDSTAGGTSSPCISQDWTAPSLIQLPKERNAPKLLKIPVFNSTEMIICKPTSGTQAAAQMKHRARRTNAGEIHLSSPPANPKQAQQSS